MKKLNLFSAAALGLGLLAVAAPIAPAAPTVALNAVVQDQQCQGGDFVNVAVAATLTPPQRNVRYSCDFNNDRVFDTAASTNPTVTHTYPDETNVTAVVKVTKATKGATDSVTFSTLDCR